MRAQIDVAAHAAGLSQKTEQLQAKITAIDAQLQQKKQQLLSAPASQQLLIKKQMMQLMQQRKQYQGHASAYTGQMMNIDQSACCGRRRRPRARGGAPHPAPPARARLSAHPAPQSQ